MDIADKFRRKAGQYPPAFCGLGSVCYQPPALGVSHTRIAEGVFARQQGAFECAFRRAEFCGPFGIPSGFGKFPRHADHETETVLKIVHLGSFYKFAPFHTGIGQDDTNTETPKRPGPIRP